MAIPAEPNPISRKLAVVVPTRFGVFALSILIDNEMAIKMTISFLYALIKRRLSFKQFYNPVLIFFDHELHEFSRIKKSIYLVCHFEAPPAGGDEKS